MSLDEFIQKLSDAGWRGLADAQHTEIVKVWDEIMCESPRMMEITRLRAELAEARKEAARLKARSIAYEDAYRVAYLATYQSHNGHWDATMQGGRSCPECIRAREARENCDAILREGLEHLVAIAGSVK